MGNCTAKKSPKKQNQSTKSPEKIDRGAAASSSERSSEVPHGRPSFLLSPNRHTKTRLSIINFGEEEATEATISSVNKRSRDVTQIRHYLSSHFLFKSLPSEILRQIIDEMKLFSFKANSIVFDLNKIGKHFFIIKKGIIEIVVDGKVNEVLEAGKGFGEVALLQDGLRTSRARSIDACELWSLSKENYKVAVKTQNIKIYSENKEFLRTLPLFNLLSESDLEALAEVLVLQSFSQCDVIVNEGEPGDLAYIIKKGTVGCYVSKEEKRQLRPGDFFGEQALLYDTRRTATVIALDQVEVLSLGRRHLSKVLGGHLESIVYRNSMRMAFDRSSTLKCLLSHQIESLVEHVEVFKYNHGEVVVEHGTCKSEKVYIVLNGGLEGDSRHDVFNCVGDEELARPSNQVFKKGLHANDASVIGSISISAIRWQKLDIFFNLDKNDFF